MNFCRLFTIVAITAAISLAQAQNVKQNCAAAHYKLTELPLHPARINRAGVVVGTTEDHKPAWWTQKDGVHEIDLPNGFGSGEATAINSSGVIVGFATRSGSNEPIAFRYADGKLSLLSGDPSKALAINDAGNIAGVSANHLVVWRGNKIAPLADCCGGVIHGISQNGEVVGRINDKEGHYTAFVWNGQHGLESIAPPHSTMSTALAINDAGHILIQRYTPNEVYLRVAGELTLIPLASDAASQPLGMSNCDVIVGEFGAASDFYHAFAWDRKNGLRDLNQFTPRAEGWILESAVDINDRGQIVGIGDHGNEQDVGFLLSPEIEPRPEPTQK
ncbi:MAG TPA: hypothetical protein VMX38_14425 [Verrucomicrobiae bacterium]|jgi:probable HAF family extracellular repeat protein|nr:hypothetical protein [Verrucomicrobiae bacterium]